MKPNFRKSEPKESSDIVQASSNAEIGTAKSSDKNLKNTDDSKQSFSVNIVGSKLPFSISQSLVIGVITVAVIATFFLVTRGNDFCFLSICNKFPFQNPILYSSGSVAVGLGTFVVFALMGVSAPIAIMGGLGAWFLMQISRY